MSSLVEYPVEEEYKRNPYMKDDIKQLRNWLRGQPHLPGDLITDLELVLVYHASDGSTEVSKQLLDTHYTLRTHASFFKLIIDDNLRRALNDALLTMLPTPAPDGTQIIYSRLLSSVATCPSIVEYLRMFLIWIDIWQHEQGTWPGLTFVVDLKNVSLSYILMIEIGVLKQFIFFIQEALLAKLKMIHFVNAPSYVDKLLMIIKPLMKPALVKLLNVHKGPNVDGLPNLSDLDLVALRDAALAKIESNQDFFKHQTSKVVVESKRPGKPKNLSKMMSVDGSFKKLEID